VNLSHRERLIAIAALASLLLLLFDHYVLTPVMDSREQLRLDAETLAGRTEDARGLFQKSKRLARLWGAMNQEGLKDEAGQAESQVLHALRDWAEESGLSLSSVKPERTEGGGDLRQIDFRAAGTGTMRAVSRFLFEMQSSELPLHIQDMQVGSHTEGQDDLSLQVHFSTLYVASANQTPAAPRAAAAARGAEGEL
jgi:hypothetical protein